MTQRGRTTTRILLIEDNTGDARLIQRMLADVHAAGATSAFELSCAGRLAAGLERLKTGGVDVVLLDLGLPDSEGMDSVRRVRAQSPSLPIIVLTGLADEEVAIQAVREGAQDYLVKGQVDGNLLGRSVRYAIERKRAEEETQRLLVAVREEKERLSALLNSISDEVWFADTRGKFTMANLRALREFRLDAGEEIDIEAFAKSLEVLRPDGSPRPVEEAPPLRALAGEVVRNQEEIIRTPALGELRYRQVSASPVKDAAGRIIGSVSVVRDITDHRYAEKALEQSERLYRSAIDAAGAVPYSRDYRRNRYEFVGERIKELTGYAKDEFTPQVWDSIILEMVPCGTFAGMTYAEAREKAFRERMTTWNCEYRIRTRTGEERWVMTSAADVRDELGNPVYSVGIFQDITERKRAEEALARSERLYRGAIEAAGAVAYYRNYETNAYDFVGSGIEALTGYPAGQFTPDLWQSIIQEALLHGELNGLTLEEATRKFLNGETRTSRGDYRITTQEGEVRWLADAAVHVFSDQGKPIGSLGLLQDITDRKRAEEQIAHMASFPELTPVLILELDREGRVLFANPAFQSGLQAIGLETPLAFVPDDIRELIRCWDGATPSQHEREAAIGDHYFLELFYFTPRFRSIRLYATDITERKRAEEALRESEDKFRYVFDHSVAGKSFTLPSGEMQANRALSEMLGYSPEEFAGRTWQEITHPDDIQASQEVVEALLSGAKERAQLTKRYLHKDGSVVWADVTTSLRRDKDGKPLYMMTNINNITDRKRAEEALERSERLYRGAIEAAGAVAYYRNYGTNTYDFIAPGIAAVTGYSAEEFTPDLWEAMVQEAVFHGERSGLSREEARRRFLSGETRVTRADYRIRTRNGEERWLADAAVSVFDEQGKLVGSLGLLQDITERKRTEEDLEATKKQIEFVLGATKTGLDIIDSQFNVRYVDPEWQKVYGEPSGRKCYEYFMDRDTVCPGCGIVKALEAKSVMVTEERLPKEGNRPIQATSIPYQDKNGDWLVAEVNVDISERKQAEEAVRAAAMEWQVTFDAISDGVCLLDMNGRILRCNRAKADLLGRPIAEVTGAVCWELMHNASRPIEGCPIERMKSSRRRETLELFQGGRWLRFCADPILDSRGDLVGAVHIVSDVTEHKRAQTEREELEKQLLQSQKLEAVGRLAAGVAHDFNNALTAIQGFTDLVRWEMEEGDPLRDDLDRVKEATQRAANLVQQLLLFSRNQPMEFVPLDLNGTVTGLLKMLKRLIGEDVAVVTELAPSLWPVRGDVGGIEQVLMNLAVNARDAMPGGGTLTFRTANVARTEEQAGAMPGAEPGRFVCLSVTDTGVGMEKEVLEHVFEPFFTTKESGKGTGLGLSVVHGIVQQHDGAIHITSRPGEGTTFQVFFPVADRPAEARSAAPDPAAKLDGRGERVLLIEDELEVRRVAARVLTRNGYTVLEAADASEARQIFDRHKDEIVLVFSDVVLPGGSSLGLIEEMLSLRPALKVILASGYTDERSQWPIITKKKYPFIHKPFRIPELLKMVKETIGKKATRQE